MTAEKGAGPIHGWLNIDKPAGMTSARVVARVRRLAGGVKAGHGGTLDPMATGVLPIALGEATKTTAYVIGGGKTYRFSVRWGEARDTDDAEGKVVATSTKRPSAADIEAALGAFIGTIEQVPPTYAAIKVGGQRAYALARRGERVSLPPRKASISHLELIETPDPETARFEVRCGKGTYVRALARDLAEHLGTRGHVTALRRTAVGQFREDEAISLDNLPTLIHIPGLGKYLHPVASVLADIPALSVTETQARRLRCGQAITAASANDGLVRVMAGEVPVALADIVDGVARPVRVFNLS